MSNIRRMHRVVFRKNVLIILSLVFIVGVVGSILYHDETQTTDGQFSSQALQKMEQVVEDCSSLSEDRSGRLVCIERRLSSAIEQEGMEGYLAALMHLMSRGDRAYVYQCHDIAHIIGQLGVRYSGSSDAIKQCTSVCGDGCYHGVVEGYVAGGGDISEAVMTLCPSENDSCFHGLGHGIASLNTDVHSSLSVCDSISDVTNRKQCAYGILMELYESTTFDRKSLALPEDLLSFCKSLGDVYDDVCFSKAGLHEYKRTDDIRSAGEICQKVNNSVECLQILGAYLYWQHQSSPHTLVDVCKQVEESAEDCVIGAMLESVNIEPYATKGYQFCALLDDDNLKHVCYSRLMHGLLYTYNSDFIYPEMITDRFMSTIITGCEALDGQPAVRQCISGIGRSFVAYHDAIILAELEGAIEYCKRAGTDDWSRVCIGGVFDQALVAFQDSSSEASAYPCSDIDEKYQEMCYLRIPRMWNSVFELSTRQMDELCMSIEFYRHREECFGGIARVAIMNDQTFLQEGSNHVCSTLSTLEGEAFCTIETVRMMYAQGHSHPEVLCDLLEHEYRNICHAAAERFSCHVMEMCGDEK